ncbi:MAG TPA: type IV toxin-antitoxin system AbiEi family antitoxin domain-containing protein [Solirubrobacterales bacterium]|nr:type IV toxin-antitoxin system AbiEi family antitoxin domain-containing protein [Solirubrobacterales bacterium]
MRSHAAVAELAASQHGLVTYAQLLRLGFSSGGISRLTGAMRLHRVHRRVYAVGHALLSDRGRCLAAAMACGRGAVVSHEAAAWLWGVLPSCPGLIDVTVPRHGGKRSKIRLHHSSTLVPEEHGRFGPIPATALPRTLLDLAATTSPRFTWSAIDRAERLNLLDLSQIDAMLTRRRGHRGAERLRKALEIYREPGFYRARSERLLRRLVRKQGLRQPRINAWVDRFEIDAYWEEERFAVEVDGWEAHRTRKAFEDDRLRREEMKLAGIDVFPVSARRIEQCPDEVGRHLALLLQRRRRELGLR